MANQPHAGHRARLRRRFLSEGLDGFEPHEMLELLMQYAIPRKDTNPLGHRLLDTFGTLDAVFMADIKDLQQVPGMGEYAAVLIRLTWALMGQIQRAAMGEKPVLDNFLSAGRYMVSVLSDQVNETMYCVCVDKNFRLLYPEIVGRGTLDQAAVHPRLIVEAALRHRATGVYLAHNHPGGSLHLSGADIEVSIHVENALRPIGVNLHDHFVVASNQFTSWRRQGQIGFFDLSTHKKKEFKAAERE